MVFVGHVGMAHPIMWSVHVFYGGEWSVDPNTNERSFINYKKIEPLLLEEDASFTDLVNLIISVMELDMEIKDRLVIEYLPKYLSKVSTIPIKNDYHVKCFLNDIIRRSEDARIPLCVSLRPPTEASHAEDNASNSPIVQVGSDSPKWTNDVLPPNHFVKNQFVDEINDHGATNEGGVPVHYPIVVEEDNVPDEQPESGEPVNTLQINELPVVQCHTTTRSSHADSGTSSDRLAAVVDVAVNDVFETREQLSLRMSMLAVKHFYEWKVVRANSRYWYIRCKHNNCPWKLNASSIGNSTAWKVNKFENTHTCQLSLVQCDNRQANPKVIGSWIKCKYQAVCRPYKPGEIIADIRQELGVNITYNKAWRSRESALDEMRGGFENSYKILPAYMHALRECNPGTFTDLEMEEDGSFKYIFFSFGASVHGFYTSMRPVVAVDACFLKGKYPGSLLVATCMDGNNQVYPIGWGVVDSENDASWEWFLEKLRCAIGDNIDGLVFVSDRHKSIEKGISTVFPNAFHGVCIYHLSNNLRAKFKRSDMLPVFFKAAKAYTLPEFNEMWRILQLQNSRVCEYLTEVGIERWSRAHSQGRRYTIMTTNIAECLNALLKDARELPIQCLVEYIRNTLQRWFHERRTVASELNTHTTPYIENELATRMREAQAYVAEPVDIHRWCVRDIANRTAVVDLLHRQCTCRVFDMDQLPCLHALAAARRLQIDHYSLCSPFYHISTLVSAYAEPIMPVGEPEDWIVPEEILSIQLTPPKPRSKSGRRKKLRIPSTGEERIIKKCGRCGCSGHNRKTCSNPYVSREEK